jgi:hypothetical protein
MTEFEDENGDASILDVADETIVTDPITPQAALFALQDPSPSARFVRGRQSFPQESQNRFLRLMVELYDPPTGSARDFNPPGLHS